MHCKTIYKLPVYAELLQGKDLGEFIYPLNGINIIQVTLVTAGQ